MRKLLIALVALGFISSAAIAQQISGNPPAGAQVIFPVDNFPINGPSGAYGPQSCSSACNGTTLLGPIDVTGYNGANIHVLSIGGGATLNFQQSSDPVCSTATNWAPLGGVNTTAQQVVGSGLASPYVISFTTAPNAYSVELSAHCFRLQFSAYTSGTITAQGFLRYAGVGPTAVWGGVDIIAAVTCTLPGQCTSSGAGGATAITGNASGTTGAVVGTLAAAISKFTWICGFNVQAIGGTAAVGPITLAGVVGSSMTFQGSSSAAGGTVASQTFTPCLQSSAQNTAITITTTANGTATAVNVNSWGFQL